MSSSLGRVIYTDRALPAGSPIRFTFGDNGLVMRCPSPGLAGQLIGKVVALLVDEVELGDDSGWHVLAVGMCRPICDRSQLGSSQPTHTEPTVSLQIVTPIITGRRVGAAAGAKA